MIAKKSKLKLIATDILDSKIVFHPNSLKGEEVMIKMHNSPINIDFEIKINEDGLYYIFASIEINNDGSTDFGYSISVNCASVIDFEDDISDAEKNDLISSGVNITITNLRGYVYAVTAYYPLGPFNFHSIDMKALFDAKAVTKNSQETNK